LFIYFLTWRSGGRCVLRILASFTAEKKKKKRKKGPGGLADGVRARISYVFYLLLFYFILFLLICLFIS
jgi:hypothetical protein